MKTCLITATGFRQFACRNTIEYFVKTVLSLLNSFFSCPLYFVTKTAMEHLIILFTLDNKLLINQSFNFILTLFYKADDKPLQCMKDTSICNITEPF